MAKWGQTIELSNPNSSIRDHEFKIEKIEENIFRGQNYQAPWKRVFGGQVLGFWALSVKPYEDWQQSVFENNLLQLCECRCSRLEKFDFFAASVRLCFTYEL